MASQNSRFTKTSQGHHDLLTKRKKKQKTKLVQGARKLPVLDQFLRSR